MLNRFELTRGRREGSGGGGMHTTLVQLVPEYYCYRSGKRSGPGMGTWPNQGKRGSTRDAKVKSVKSGVRRVQGVRACADQRESSTQ